MCLINNNREKNPKIERKTINLLKKRSLFVLQKVENYLLHQSIKQQNCFWKNKIGWNFQNNEHTKLSILVVWEKKNFTPNARGTGFSELFQERRNYFSWKSVEIPRRQNLSEFDKKRGWHEGKFDKFSLP